VLDCAWDTRGVGCRAQVVVGRAVRRVRGGVHEGCNIAAVVSVDGCSDSIEPQCSGAMTSRMSPAASHDSSPVPASGHSSASRSPVASGPLAPLRAAIVARDIRAVFHMLRVSAEAGDVSFATGVDSTGVTNAHVAARYGLPRVLDALQAAGCDLDAVDGQGRTVLHAAAAGADGGYQAGCAECVTMLVTRGWYRLAARDGKGRTALHHAVHARSALACRRLLSAAAMATRLSGMTDEWGLDVNAVDWNGHTALHLAAAGGDSECIVMLAGGTGDRAYVRARLNDCVGGGGGGTATALTLAVAGGHVEAVESLVELGAAVSPSQVFAMPAKMQEVVLRAAAARGDKDMVSAVLSAAPAKAADLNAMDFFGRTALMRACTGGHGEVVTQLLAAGADALVKDPVGRTALHFACVQNRPAAVKALADAGTLLWVPDSLGRTPLLVASQHGSAECVAVLLTRKWSDVTTPAKPSLHNAWCEPCDVWGRTPAMAAAYGGHADVAAMLADATPPCPPAAVPPLLDAMFACCRRLIEVTDARGRWREAMARECRLLREAARAGQTNRGKFRAGLRAHLHTQLCYLDPEAHNNCTAPAFRTIPLLIGAGACAPLESGAKLPSFHLSSNMTNLIVRAPQVAWLAAACGGDVDGRCPLYHATPLETALIRRQHGAVAALMAAGAQLHDRDEFGRSLLHRAACSGDARMVEMLLRGTVTLRKDDVRMPWSGGRHDWARMAGPESPAEESPWHHFGADWLPLLRDGVEARAGFAADHFPLALCLSDRDTGGWEASRAADGQWRLRVWLTPRSRHLYHPDINLNAADSLGITPAMAALMSPSELVACRHPWDLCSLGTHRVPGDRDIPPTDDASMTREKIQSFAAAAYRKLYASRGVMRVPAGTPPMYDARGKVRGLEAGWDGPGRIALHWSIVGAAAWQRRVVVVMAVVVLAWWLGMC